MKDLRQPIISGFLKDRERDILTDINNYKPENRRELSNIIIDNVDKHLEELYAGNPTSFLQEELLNIAEYILDNDTDNLVNEFIEEIENY